MARENTALQIDVLKRLFRRQYIAETLTVEQLLAKAAGAGAVMEDGVEVIGVTFEGGSTSGMLMYPKEVVATAALDVLDQIDAEAAENGVDNPGVIHSDLSTAQIET